jgi:hypothetical protein
VIVSAVDPTIVTPFDSAAGVPLPPVRSGLIQYLYPAASRVSIVSGGISLERDSSGNGRDVAQNTGSARPAWDGSEIGGRPVTVHSGAQWLDSTAGSAIVQSTTLIVASAAGSTLNSHILDGLSAGTRQVLWIPSTSPKRVQFFVGGGGINGDVDYETAHTYVGIVKSGGGLVLRIDGSQVATGGVATGVLTGYRIGARFSGTLGSTAKFAAICLWDRELSAGEITSVEAWARALWGTW